MSTAQFYDGLADTYHALYPDWRSESRAQGEALDRLLSRWHHGPADVADVACGIGTQLLGLAGGQIQPKMRDGPQSGTRTRSRSSSLCRLQSAGCRDDLAAKRAQIIRFCLSKMIAAKAATAAITADIARAVSSRTGCGFRVCTAGAAGSSSLAA